MVEKLKTILAELESHNGSVWLFALLKMDEVTDRWSVVISAPWIKENNRKEKFEEILNALKKQLSSEELFSIARIGILPKEDHLIQELSKKNTGETITKEEKINGNIVHEGQVIKVNISAEQSVGQLL